MELLDPPKTLFALSQRPPLLPLLFDESLEPPKTLFAVSQRPPLLPESLDPPRNFFAVSQRPPLLFYESELSKIMFAYGLTESGRKEVIIEFSWLAFYGLTPS